MQPVYATATDLDSSRSHEPCLRLSLYYGVSIWEARNRVTQCGGAAGPAEPQALLPFSLQADLIFGTVSTALESQAYKSVAVEVTSRQRAVQGAPTGYHRGTHAGRQASRYRLIFVHQRSLELLSQFFHWRCLHLIPRSSGKGSPYSA